MFIKIPFESEIDFKSNIREITKMSLEHDYNINDGVILGNFYISGEYKTHELSINTEEFKYTLPFTVELRNDINRESLEFNIEDFSYDIVDNSKLKVNIEYSLSGEVIDEIEEDNDEELFERIDDEKMESNMAFMDEILESGEDKEEESDEKIEDDSKEVEKEIIKEEVNKDREDIKEELKKEEITEEIINERLDESETKTIMDTIKNSDDTFITYHIHIVKESDTFESISTMYKVPTSLINEYNNLETLNVGDKILIPIYDE